MNSINAPWDSGMSGFRSAMRQHGRRAAFARRSPEDGDFGPPDEPGNDGPAEFDPRSGPERGPGRRGGPHARGSQHSGQDGGRGRRRGPRRGDDGGPFGGPGAGPDGPGFGRGFGPGFGRGFGPDFDPGFGPGPRGRGRRGPGGRRSRGDIRLAVLALLAERPRHGYEIIQEIGERTQGAWRPSPGSVYPTLQQLADEGLVRAQEGEGRRTVELTEEGTTWVEAHRDELANVWITVGDEVAPTVTELREQYGQLHAAVLQIMTAGTDEQRQSAASALAEARKAIYRLLAE